MTDQHPHLRLSAHRRLACATWLALAAAPFAYSTTALAEESCGDSTCPQGYTCEVAPGACLAIFCDGPGCAPCDPRPVEYCAPAACSSNADCGEGMLCAEHATTVCEDATSPACAPGERCEVAPDERNCTSETTFSCTPRWQLPCGVDADCGAGFTCEEQETCSTPAYPADPGDREPASAASRESFEVTCEPSGVFACVAEPVECASSADCPADWTCSAVNDTVCTDAAGGNDCQLAARASFCQPPYSHLGSTGVLLTANAEADSAGGDDLALPRATSGDVASSSGAGCSLGGAQGASRSGVGSGLGFAFFALGAAWLRARRRGV